MEVQAINYILRSANIEDYGNIFSLKSNSVRPYVEKLWGWDEEYQRNDFNEDFSHIDQFQVIEVAEKFVGFIQSFGDNECISVAEMHLLPQYRGMGIGSDILRHFQEQADALGEIVRIGCFKENRRAKELYQRLSFVLMSETETHYILEYKKITEPHN